MKRPSIAIAVCGVLYLALSAAAQTQSSPRGMTKEFQDPWASAQQHMDAKNDAGAEEIILPALDRARQEGNKDAEAEFLRGLGASYQHRSKFHEALNYYGQSLSIRQELAEEAESARLFRGIGEMHALLREDDEAISFLKKADAAYAKLNQASLEAQTLSTLGQVYNRQGRMDESATALTKACRIFQDAKDELHMAECSLVLADLNVRRSEFRDGLEQGFGAMSAFTALKRPDGTAQALDVLGLAFMNMEQPEKALNYYQQGSRGAPID
jgi:tetratricopeptide (TPR) repeat protein